MNDLATANGVTDWPKVGQAAEMLGVSPRQLRRFVKSGEVERKQDLQGIYRYNPESLAKVTEAIEGAEDDAAEREERQAEPSHEGTLAGASAAAFSGIADAIKELGGLLKQNQIHIQALHSQFLSNTEKVLGAVLTENTALRTQMEAAFTSRVAYFEAAERLRSEEAERKLIGELASKKEERVQTMWKGVAKHAPLLWTQIQRSFGVSGDATPGTDMKDPRILAAMQLFNSLGQSPETLDLMLTNPDLLNEEQKRFLRIVVGKHEEPKK